MSEPRRSNGCDCPDCVGATREERGAQRYALRVYPLYEPWREQWSAFEPVPLENVKLRTIRVCPAAACRRWAKDEQEKSRRNRWSPA